MFLEQASASLFAERSVQGYITLISVFSIGVLLEVIARKPMRDRYLSRNFRLDVFYYIFYYGGLYHILLFAPLYSLLMRTTSTYAPWMQLNLISGLSAGWQIVVAVLVSDFVGYWVHRVKHVNSFLWAFHAIHHSQERLTVMTNYRVHIVDETLLRLALFIPFQIVGADFKIWITVDFAMAWILLLEHSEWNWTYGSFGRLIVSPRYHQIHHSNVSRHQTSNYAALFSFWDDLFGTAERDAPAPTTFGIGPDKMPETFVGQLVWPFTRVLQNWRSSPAPVPAPVLGSDHSLPGEMSITMKTR